MKRKNIASFLILLPLFEPKIFVKFQVLNLLFASLALFIFAYLILKYLIEGRRFSFVFFAAIIFRVSLFVPFFRNPFDLLSWGYLSLVIMDMILIFELHNSNNELNLLIRNLSIIFTAYLFINALTYIFTDGLYRDPITRNILYFLGIRTRFGEFALTSIALCLLDYFNNKSKARLIFGLICAITNVLLAWVVTAIFMILFSIFLTAFLIVIKPKKIFVFLPLILIFIFSMYITFGKGYSNFSELLVMFGKDGTMSNRTILWEKAIILIRENPIIGYGNYNDGNFIFNNGRLWQAHNQILQALLEGGFFSLMFFAILIIACVNNYKKQTNNKYIVVLLSFLFGYIIGMISEIYYYYPAFYVILFLNYCFSNLHYNGEKNVVSYNS